MKRAERTGRKPSKIANQSGHRAEDAGVEAVRAGDLPLSEALQRIRGLEGEIARTLQGMAEKVHQLETLMQFSNLLNSTLDTAVVREKALEATCGLLRCETASLLLVDRKTAELYWETVLGETGEVLKSIRLPINDRSIAGFVAMTGEPLLLNDVGQDPRHNRAAAARTGIRTRNMICIPLRAKGRIVGVLQALNKIQSVPPKPSSHPWADFIDEDLKLLETLGNQVGVAIENSRLYTELKQGFYDTVEALAESIEKKDHYTGGHTKRVVHYSMCIAKYLELSQEELERVRLAALLHDIGKIGIDDVILKKNAPLSAEEWRVMQRHPELGHDIMARVESLQDVIAGMRFHHERWDGKGYPLGLKGEEIPVIARIIAVADTYDAIVSTRPYRKGMDPRKAHDEILRHGGTQFDPTVVEAFEKAFEREKMGKGSSASRLANCD